MRYSIIGISLVFLFTGFDSHAQQSDERWQWQGIYRFDLQPDSGESPAKASTQHLWWSAPKEWLTQRDTRIESVNPHPTSTYIDPQNGSQIYYWEFSGSDNPGFEARFSWRSIPYESKVDPARIMAVDAEDKILVNYLKSDAVITLSTPIRSLADKLTATKTNARDQANAFFKWIEKNLIPPEGAPKPDPRLLLPESEYRTSARIQIVGSPEFSFLFCALCRASGIPARPVSGFLLTPKESIPHVWAEFYLRPYGWIPVDPWLAHAVTTSKQFSGFPQDPDFYFGSQDPFRLILSKGSAVELRPQEMAKDDGVWIRQGRASYFQVGVWNTMQIPRSQYELTVKPVD